MPLASGLISPQLTKLHGTLDMSMQREFLNIPFERYADDGAPQGNTLSGDSTQHRNVTAEG